MEVFKRLVLIFVQFAVLGSAEAQISKLCALIFDKGLIAERAGPNQFVHPEKPGTANLSDSFLYLYVEGSRWFLKKNGRVADSPAPFLQTIISRTELTENLTEASAERNIQTLVANADIQNLTDANF